MNNEERFNERYLSGDTPWDTGQSDFNLIEVVTQRPIPRCKALDVGCGTGDNSIWLARKHFQVVGVDISAIALEMAKIKAAKNNVACDFKIADFLSDPIEEGPFGFVFDRGCFHSFSDPNERCSFVRNVAAHLSEGGLWLTLVGNADERRHGLGPPQLTAGDVVMAVEPCFEILSLTSSHFDSAKPSPARAWRCLMRKRLSA